MEQDPTYIIWHPSLNNKDENSSSISFNITPIATLDLPKNSRDFYIQILETIGINIDPNYWDIITYRSNYYRDLEAKYWKDYWSICWRVNITLNGHISGLPKLSEEDIEIYAYDLDSPWNEGNDPPEIGCMIIADFKNETLAEKVKTAINSSAKVQKLAKDISAPTPEFYSV